MINKIHWCVAVCAVNCTINRRSCCSNSNNYRSDSQIFIENRNFCLSYLHSTPPLGRGPSRNIARTFGMEKLEWCGYPIVKKVWGYDYSFWLNTRTWRTDGRTNGHRIHRSRVSVASGGKPNDQIKDEKLDFFRNIYLFYAKTERKNWTKSVISCVVAERMLTWELLSLTRAFSRDDCRVININLPHGRPAVGSPLMRLRWSWYYSMRRCRETEGLSSHARKIMNKWLQSLSRSVYHSRATLYGCRVLRSQNYICDAACCCDDDDAVANLAGSGGMSKGSERSED